MTEDLLIIEREGYVYTLSINRPERRNALNFEFLTRLNNALNELKDNKEARVLILRGAGEKAFCSGMDLGNSPGSEERDDILARTIENIISLPQPVIAMIYGYALGSGCDLAVACDLRVASDDARLGINPVKLGWIYYPKAIQRFINLMGVGYTKELFLTGRFFNAQRAKEMGLINYAVPTSELSSFTYSLAQEIAENAPLAVSATKTIINKLLSYQRFKPEEEAEMEAIEESTWQSEDVKEGLNAFAEKRKPKFKGR